MSREEAMKALIESGMELRRDDIELGKKLERERIIKLLEEMSFTSYELEMRVVDFDSAFALIQGEQK